MKKWALRILIILFMAGLGLVSLYAISGFVYKLTGSQNEKLNIFYSAMSSGEVVGSTAGAFLGFGASLIIESIIISWRKRKSIANIISEIKSVLAKIDGELRLSDKLKNKIQDWEKNRIQDWKGKDLINAFDEDEKTEWNTATRVVNKLAYEIYLPIWDTILQNGDLLEFKNHSYFKGLIEVYKDLKKLQNLIDMVFEISSESEDVDSKLLEIMTSYYKLHRDLESDEDLKALLNLRES